MKSDPASFADGASIKTVLLFIVNVDWFFLSHRLAIAKAAQAAGYDVHVACRLTGRGSELEAEGLSVHDIRIDRGTIGIGGQIRAIQDLAAVVRKIQPTIVHCITIKPILLGGAAARFTGVPLVIAAISGLGYVFISQGFVASLRRTLLGFLYRFALSTKRVRVIFQNDDDRRLIQEIAGLNTNQIRFIYGSGVDLKRFHPRAFPVGRFTVVFAARLLVDKGLREFVTAATKIRAAGADVRFIVAGSRDIENPACIPEDELAAWRAEGVVEFVGHVTDMASFYADAHAVVLPSYREGMPLSLLEAAAIGRAVVTTDVPGCRDAIDPGVTGFLVPARDSDSLVTTITRLIDDPALCAEMGRQGTFLAARKFSIDNVIDQHLRIYAEASI